MTCASRLIAVVVLAVTGAVASAGPTQTSSAGGEWRVAAYEIPMRDGIRLHTLVVAPAVPGQPMPIRLQRTPYGTPDRMIGKVPDGVAAGLAEEGYLHVVQDIRGRHKSEGAFVMLRPPHSPRDTHGTDECTDAYDTIDWLIHHVPANNGRVGIEGGSYDGWLAAMALIHPHPALKAAVPQAPVADMFLGDDFHHNGAFRLSYGFEYVWMMESGKDQNSDWPIDLPDAYDWYLRLGPLSSANSRFLHGSRPTWNDFVAHPNYDSFWRRQAVTSYLHQPLTVPTMLVGGWYDQEDFYGPQRIYAELARHDPHHLAYLVLGPWNHGGWAGAGDKLGPIDFGDSTGGFYNDAIVGPWLDHWLKGASLPEFPHVWTFETGTNRWQRRENWPPKESRPRSLFLAASGAASFQPPAERDSDASDSYVSDPVHPVPYRKGPIVPTYRDGSTWSSWLTDDQRYLESRTDVLTWKTAPLTEDLTVAGDVVADLFASTSGTDSDWVVKLIDVYPDGYHDAALAGYELIISDEVFRGRFRKSFERPTPTPQNAVERYTIDLHTADHTFLKGHRIAVQIQSSWFPLIDRNPQRFVPNIFDARAEDFQPATQRVYRSRHHPTHIVLPLAAPRQSSLSRDAPPR